MNFRGYNCHVNTSGVAVDNIAFILIEKKNLKRHVMNELNIILLLPLFRILYIVTDVSKQ